MKESQRGRSEACVIEREREREAHIEGEREAHIERG